MIWWCLGNLESIWNNNFRLKSQDSKRLGERRRLKRIFEVDIECSKVGRDCCGTSHKSQGYVQVATLTNLAYLAIRCAIPTYIKPTWKHFQVLGLLYHHVPLWTVKRYRFSELILVFDKNVFRWSWMADHGAWDGRSSPEKWCRVGPGPCGTRDLGCARVCKLAVCLSTLSLWFCVGSALAIHVFWLVAHSTSGLDKGQYDFMAVVPQSSFTVFAQLFKIGRLAQMLGWDGSL